MEFFFPSFLSFFFFSFLVANMTIQSSKYILLRQLFPSYGDFYPSTLLTIGKSVLSFGDQSSLVLFTLRFFPIFVNSVKCSIQFADGIKMVLQNAFPWYFFFFLFFPSYDLMLQLLLT